MEGKIEQAKDEWKGFLSAVDSYIYTRTTGNRINEVIKQGLGVLKLIPNTRAVSIFLFNQETSVFEHKASLPSGSGESATALFNKLTSNGAIGRSLQTATILTHSPDKSDTSKDYCIAIPLIVPSGVLGIALVILENLPQKFNPVLLKFCLLYGNLFASTIDNALLHKHLNQTRELLEQKVAIRTMHLSQSKRELNAIIDSVHNGILVIDAKTNLINRANPVASQLIKIDESSISGKLYNQFLDYDGSTNLPDDNQNYESLLKDSNGSLIPILRTVSFINLGQVKLRIESFLDISERKKYEEELQKSNEILERKVKERTEDLEMLVHKLKDEVQEKEKAQGEILKMLEKEKELSELKTKFVSMVSHEFRTPLTIIRSSAQLMEKFFAALSDDEKKEYLDKIVKTVDFMKDQIENVIFIGKSDTSKIQLSPASISIAEFCRNLINDFQLTLNTKRIIRFNYKGSNRRVLIDTKVLKHVIVNVLSNAVKYSPNDKPVDFSVILEGNSVIFNIQDYGIGIPEEEQKKIFELFYRGKNVGNISGTGLGMSVIVRSLEILNGKIELSSRVNIGTTFTIIIPVV